MQERHTSKHQLSRVLLSRVQFAKAAEVTAIAINQCGTIRRARRQYGEKLVTKPYKRGLTVSGRSVDM